MHHRPVRSNCGSRLIHYRVVTLSRLDYLKAKPHRTEHGSLWTLLPDSGLFVVPINPPCKHESHHCRWSLQTAHFSSCAQAVLPMKFEALSHLVPVGNKGVGNLRLIGLVGLGPATRVSTFHLLDSLLTATTDI